MNTGRFFGNSMQRISQATEGKSGQFATDADGLLELNRRQTEGIAHTASLHGPTDQQAQPIDSGAFHLELDRDARGPHSAMTVGDFVKHVFVPEHVAMKQSSGRIHYQALLKHVLTPEEVESVFRVDMGRSKTKLRAVRDWPYLGGMRLRDTQPGDVQRLVSAASAHGYSAQTVKHIRGVVSAIFAQARKKQYFDGDNPASLVTLPGVNHKKTQALTLAQAKEVLAVMRYPEREMALMAILTTMNMAEICGLQWKCVNLTEAWSNTDDEPIPPGTIAVRKEWYLGELISVGRKSRRRNLPIPESVLAILIGLSHRANFKQPDDFVLASPAGTPINERQIAASRLKPIGSALHMPWLSWQVLRRTHKTLAYELGMQSLGGMTIMPDSAPS